MSSKYYAVLAGNKPGVYTTWAEAQAQVSGFSGAKFKSFHTLEEAQEYVNGSKDPFATSATPQTQTTVSNAELVVYTDGSYNPATDVVGSSVVIRSGSKTVDNLHLVRTISNKHVDDTRNVGGELIGATTAIDYAIAKNFKSIEIFFDYQGVGSWANKEWRRKTELAKKYLNGIEARRGQIDITFTKTTAHVGVELNELADRLAKFACGAELTQKDAAMLTTLPIINLDVEKY